MQDYTVMKNWEDVFCSNILPVRVYILIIGYWRLEEDKDISGLKEVFEDISSLTSSETKPKPKHTEISSDYTKNGWNSNTRTISQTWPQWPEDQQPNNTSHSIICSTSVFYKKKPMTGISSKKEITDGSLPNKCNGQKTQENSPTI